MYDDGRVVDLPGLLEDAAGWFELVIPDATPAVRLLRLHVDPRTRASVALVAFPPGWSRPGAGHYVAGEEFVVLTGSLAVSGHEHRAGSWAWIPPCATRSDSHSQRGALALAWFSGPVLWRGAVGDQSATSEVTYGQPTPGRLRRHRSGVPGSSHVVAALGNAPLDMEQDLLSLPDLSWTLLPANHRPPPLNGPVLVRLWT